MMALLVVVFWVDPGNWIVRWNLCVPVGAITIFLLIRVWFVGVTPQADGLLLRGFFRTHLYPWDEIARFERAGYYLGAVSWDDTRTVIIEIQSSAVWTSARVDRIVTDLNGILAARRGIPAPPAPPPTPRRFPWSVLTTAVAAAIAGEHNHHG
jgi:hypothetical protein